MNDKNNKAKTDGFSKKNNASESSKCSDNLVYGRNAVKELLESGRAIDKVFVQKGEREGSIVPLCAEILNRKIPMIEVYKQKLDELSCGGRHQGIVASVAEKEYSSIEEMIAYAESRNETPFLVLCDNLEDPHNLGAIIRTAECAGVHGILIPKRHSVSLTSVVSKASAGALEHMRIARITNVTETIKELQEQGFWAYAADMDGVPYNKQDYSGKVLLVLGSEGFGIQPLVKNTCDFVVSIPLHGHVNSLNVSAAGAILMYEISKQKYNL